MESTVPNVAGETPPGSAHFYYPRLALDPRYGVHDAPPVDLSCHLPAVGFLSTPSDLVRFGAAMMDGSLLAPATVEELTTPFRLDSEAPSEQALGWTAGDLVVLPDDPPTRIVGQGLGSPVVRRPLSAVTVGGQVAGGTASLLLVPEHRLAVAVATNVSGSATVAALSIEVAGVFVRRLADAP